MADTGLARAADPAGVAGALIAALCCASVPAVVGVLSAVGLSFLLHDAILLPLLALSLALALWGLARGRAVHGLAGPLVLGFAGSAALLGGVFAARALLFVGAALLVGAVGWNALARRRAACGVGSEPYEG